MNFHEALPYIIFFAPLLGSLFAGVLLIRSKAIFAEYISSFLVISSAICSGIVFYQSAKYGISYDIKLFDWIALQKFQSTISISIDSITAIMLFVVTLVSSVVHIYSIGYMHEDPYRQRFFSYLSLFTFFMIILVTSRDFLQLFLGWEGVGLCSYLLIGFWFKKESANLASIKAFIVNRVADVFMASGVCLIYYTFGTLAFADIFPQISEGISSTYYEGEITNIAGFEIQTLTLAGMLLFLGAMGKSAQLFFHVWLPDAMEGPTPVSALIHAATMVTAGVFLMSKCWIFVENSLFLQQFITYIGATTAIFAATVALVQTDIKKIIAYSTCSQLGYMFFAIGVLAPTAGMFHLVTHAFFKALLFLGAGSVIHACHHEQDIFKMGGLWRKIPFTFTMFMVGSIAIAGLYPLSGYFSKDAILEAAFASHSTHGNYAFALGITAAFLTSFYSWRLISLVFHGKYRGNSHHHPHESPISMLIPLFILAIPSVLAGYFGHHFHILEASFWRGVINTSNETIEKMHHVSLFIKYLPSILSVIAIILAYVLYIKYPKNVNEFGNKISPVRTILQKKYYFDETYQVIFLRPMVYTARFFSSKIEKIIDAILPHGFVSFIKICSDCVTRLQSGIVFIYFIVFFSFISLIFQYYSFINNKGLIYYTIIWLKNLFN